MSTIALSPASLAAQTDGNGYLFRAPSGTLTLRAGAAIPTASSNVFSFVSEHLTIDRGDFASPTLAAEMGFVFKRRFEAQFGVGFAGTTVKSNYRDFVDNDDREIEQNTHFRRVPVTVGLKYYLTPLGRSIGRHAWIPTRVAPYVSGGIGGVYYRFRQEGDFVDFKNLDVFNANLESSDWGAAGYGAIGLVYTVAPRAALLTEARYDVSRAPMGFGFEGFDKIDLSGGSITAGLQFRF